MNKVINENKDLDEEENKGALTNFIKKTDHYI